MPNKRPVQRPAPKAKRSALLPWIICAVLVIAIAVVVILIVNTRKPAGDFGSSDEVFADTAEFTESDWEAPESEVPLGDAPAEGVVAAYNGGTLTTEEVLPLYEQRQAEQMFGESGEDLDAEKEDILLQAVRNRILRDKAAERGLLEPTADEAAQLEMQADALYADQRALYAEEGHEFADEAVMLEMGITRDSLLEALRKDLWQQKLAEAIGREIEVSEDELKTAYDALLQEQQAQFDADPAAFSTAANSGEPIAYVPANSRRVRSILIAFDDAETVLAAQALFDRIAASENVDEKLALNDELNALYTELDARANEVIDRLSRGEDFLALMDEVGRDPMMKTEPMRTNGYCVNPSTNDLFSAEYVEGCLYLEAAGQYTPVSMRSPEGVHIIQLVGDLQSGPVAYEAVRDDLLQSIRQSRASDAYDAQVDTWMREADIRVYPDAFEP